MSDPPPNRRFRISPKWVFLILTLAALASAYLGARANWRSQAARRHNALTSKIVDNLLDPPKGVSYTSANVSKNHLDRFFAGSWDERRRLFDFSGAARFSGFSMTEQTFAYSPPAGGSLPADLCQQLLNAYARGFGELGFSSTTSSHSGERCRRVWTRDGVLLLVEIWLDPEKTNGGILILLDDRQEFHIW
jgi:hypothetical protein